MAIYRVWIQVERAENGGDEALSLGPPEVVFEAPTRREVVEYLRRNFGAQAKATIEGLRPE